MNRNNAFNTEIAMAGLLHADIYSVEQLDVHGEELSRSHVLDTRKGSDQLLRLLDENEKLLKQAYNTLSKCGRSNIRLTPAGAWLLDNFYLIQEQIEIARSHLPKKYSQKLPRLFNKESTGMPRIYNVVNELILHVDGRVDGANLSAIIVSYQHRNALQLGELWAIPIMLRLALIGNLTRLACRIEVSYKNRRQATVWADKMLHTAEHNPNNMILDLADLSRTEVVLSSTFVTELVRRIQGQGPALNLPITWIEQRLSEQGRTIERQVQMESQMQAINQISVSNSIGSLRFLAANDWSEFVETMSLVEQVLRKDPAGIYPQMDFATRDRYRHVIEKISRQSQYSEVAVAKQALALAGEWAIENQVKSHVGYYLIDAGSKELHKSSKMQRSLRDIAEDWLGGAPLFFYLAPSLALSVILAGLGTALVKPLSIAWFVVTGVLFLLASELSLALVNWFTTKIVRPKTLPRMDYSQNIPEHSCTLVVVPTMLSSQQGVNDLLNKIEVCYLSDHSSQIYFGLLTDFKDADSQVLPEDAGLLAQVRDGILELNQRYVRGAVLPFLLFHRPRKWNPTENVWMGYERKRGKLEELNQALRSDTRPEILLEGNALILKSIQYVITLDTDTLLPRDVARHLIETISHPLNAAIYNDKLKRVTSGYSILQPRVVASLSRSTHTLYAKIFANSSGIDPYTRAISDVYQDVFGEGSFIGKGIYQVDMMSKVLGGRLPENLILSHDLLEGTYGRSGFVSDLQFIEEFPEKYSDDVARRFRWIRGDWQLLFWILPWVPGLNLRWAKNPISMLSRWKLLDNIRRSVVAPAMLLLILANWYLQGQAWLGIVVCFGVLFLPAVPEIALSLWHKPKKYPVKLHLMSWLVSSLVPLQQAVFNLMMVPYESINHLCAISKSVWRLVFTHKHLLEWTTSAQSESTNGTSLGAFQKRMWMSPLISILALATLWMLQRRVGVDQCILLGLWLLAPSLAWLVSSNFARVGSTLTLKQMKFLRKISRKTWHYFESFVTVEDNWLVPDNYQEAPLEATAHRTSPTNIGIMLLSNLGAMDLGYLSTGQCIDRVRKSFKTMDAMEKFRGHFFNWYDTRNLEPLHPHYISTVDSGNLMGFLVTLSQGLLARKELAILSKNFHRGLIDTLLVLCDNSKKAEPFNLMIRILEEQELNSSDLLGITQNLTSMIHQIQALRNAETNPDEWLNVLELQCQSQLDDISYLIPWLASIEDVKAFASLQVSKPIANYSLLELAQLMDVVPHTASATLQYQIRQGSNRASERIAQLEELAVQSMKFADQDFDFIYDKSRRLLSIGYDVGKHKRDDGYYDLVASEARLASFVGIAQGKLPLEHWFSMGRHVTIFNGKMVLLSWGGSMFEYLMPRLIMPSYPKTLLDQTLQGMLEKQIAYGKEQGVPWGISESGMNITDAYLNYQYRSFGVPGLGFKNDLAHDLVIAPYASMLAMMVDPEESCENLQRMSELGYEGKFGFYEAIDHTPVRLAPPQTEAVVKSFMAHHQGMGFLSMVNFFLDDIMIKRFTSDSSFASTAHLLQERIPKTKPFHFQSSVTERTLFTSESEETLLRIFTTPKTLFPEVHLLSNGRYHVMITNAGGGYSKWRDIMVTRWRSDATQDNFGSFFYVQDLTRAQSWSAFYHPLRVDSKKYEAIFPQARAEFRRRDDGIETYTEIAVLPEDDVETRRITIGNFSAEARDMEVTSYAEVLLTSMASDASHPAYSNLFMESEIDQEHKAILCSRRPRTPGEVNPWMVHLLAVEHTAAVQVSFETDRLQFIGRGRTVANPRALDVGAKLNNSCGAVLDPIVAIRGKFRLAAGESITMSFITGIAETRAKANALVDRYQDRNNADRVFDLALIHGSIILQQINATEADAQLYGKLASSILYPSFYRRALPSILSKNRRGQSSLWAYAISGDLPILLLRISDIANLTLVAKLIQAHAYWRIKGLAVDLVIWNEDWSGYRQELNARIIELITTSTEANFFEKSGGIFVRHAEMISEEDGILIQSCASVVLTDTGGTLFEQVQQYPHQEQYIPLLRGVSKGTPNVIRDHFQQTDLLFYNGWGGFSKDGREYIIHIKPDSPPPMPWCNVIANKQFGTVVSQSGGYSWAENAHEFRLTPWYNDPVTDATGEVHYLRNEVTGKFWSTTPLPCPAKSDYLQRQGFGYTVFECNEDGIKTELWNYVDTEAAVKFWFLKTRNDSGVSQSLSSTLFLELVLGESRSKTQMHTRTYIDSKTGALFATNPFNAEFPDRVMFLESSITNRTVSGDRAEFLGRNGSNADPDAMHRVRLSGRVGAGLDPAAVMQVPFTLEPGQEMDMVFIMGCGRNVADARELVFRHRSVAAAYLARDRVWEFWNRTLGSINVETPDPSFNILANGWLLYQTMSSRFFARSGYYQSGGAYGFRDQLQDVMAFVHSRPDLIREHLLLCASRQFGEGDVQHWWHPPQGRGVRTHISDDYLWLPLVACMYVEKIGDTGILDQNVSFLEGRLVNPDEESYYDLPRRSEVTATLYEHCKRSIHNGLRFGEHGLPLMGSGDWNDGMNHVGSAGKGESVWLGFFLVYVMEQFVRVANRYGDVDYASKLQSEREQLIHNLNEYAWDGNWYLRAFFDNGAKLGSAQNEECRIDSIAQSWSVLSGAGTPERKLQALQALESHLVHRDDGIISLLDPPFNHSVLEPGYIKGYVPGVRENGGQYTHAAVWAVMAFAQMGDAEKANELLALINPINHGSSAQAIQCYKVEPYVMAADIYGVAPHIGRGGWTWYTGSSSWMYRLMIDIILGLDLQTDKLHFKPCVPAEWNDFQVHYKFHDTLYHLHFHKGSSGQAKQLELDGVPQPELVLPLSDDHRVHQVEVRGFY